jgi:hypothetical protein
LKALVVRIISEPKEEEEEVNGENYLIRRSTIATLY